jgi:hypothetical protein
MEIIKKTKWNITFHKIKIKYYIPYTNIWLGNSATVLLNFRTLTLTPTPYLGYGFGARVRVLKYKGTAYE